MVIALRNENWYRRWRRPFMPSRVFPSRNLNHWPTARPRTWSNGKPDTFPDRLCLLKWNRNKPQSFPFIKSQVFLCSSWLSLSWVGILHWRVFPSGLERSAVLFSHQVRSTPPSWVITPPTWFQMEVTPPNLQTNISRKVDPVRTLMTTTDDSVSIRWVTDANFWHSQPRWYG